MPIKNGNVEKQIGVSTKNHKWLNIMRIDYDLNRVNEIISALKLLLEDKEINTKFHDILVEF